VLHLVVVSPIKEKKKKKNINNDLGVFPSHDSNVDSRYSVGGFVFDVARGCVSWSSKKQVSVATSSVEAEYMASANATKEAVWLRTLLKKVGYPQSQATIVHANNQGTTALAQNPIFHSRAKHIDIRFHFIRECIERNEIKL